MENITIRFNGGRFVASFDTVEDLTNWVRNSDLYQPFMYTIHGLGNVLDLEKFKKILKNTWIFEKSFVSL